LSTLIVEFIGVPGVGFLLAVLETGAGVSFQHPVFGAEVAVAETAVTNDALGSFLALLEIATRLARSHAGWLWRER
jgi:hypothetical protein